MKNKIIFYRKWLSTGCLNTDLLVHDCLQDSSPLHASDLCKSDDLQKFKELTLADLKVMGIVGKVCLLT